MTYPHLGLKEWPFRIVPEPEFCDFIADRHTLRKDVEDLLCSLENRPTSDIQLIWSWYGAGKTHTVYYLANQCSEKHGRLLPIYTELPREAKGFVDLYRVAISQFAVEKVIDAFLEFTTRPPGKTTFTRTLDPDLGSALTQAAVGDKRIQMLLGQWLLGNPLTQSSLRELGVGARPNTTEKCAVVLADLVWLLAPRNPAAGEVTLQRVIWIVDEVQRVEELPPAARRSVLSGLVGVFNRCPTGLTMLMSYTGTPKEGSLPDWITEDLKDRIGLERPMLLPPLRSDEAMVLIRELLARFRLPEAAHLGAFHPFEESAIEALVRALSKKNDLKPRNIMEALDASLRHLEPGIRSGAGTTIGLTALKESLSRFPLDWSESNTRGPKGKRA
jgi:hypothetical protein